MSPEVVWSLPKRVLFRFAFVAGALYAYPWPLGFIPKTGWLAEPMSEPWTQLVLWFAESVLGVGRPATQMTGSGDTLFSWVSFLLTLIAAALGTAVWSVLDRRRRAYPRLAAGAWVVMRYLLAFTLLSYGFAKIINTQFPPPSPIRLDTRIGDASPMGLLWTFQGYSMPYTLFGGLAEAVAGVLLLWRRTTTLGALVAIAVMTNVVMLNLCYDVPVKLYSMQLLLIAGLIVLPQARRVLAALLGYAVPDVPARVRMGVRRERIRLAAKLLFIGATVWSTYEQVTASLSYRYRPVHELVGIWVVETWSANGQERPPLTTDAERWRKLILTTHGAQIRAMTDERTFVQAKVDAERREIVVTIKGKEIDGRKAEDKVETWRYTRPDADHLIIDGRYAEHDLHITLVREPDGLLVTRGFHWIQEHPFNR